MTELAKALSIQDGGGGGGGEDESLAALVSSDDDDDDDYVPDSLKDFFAQADAALNAKLMDFDNAAAAGDSTAVVNETEDSIVLPAAMMDFTPMTESKGPYDTDLGSACHLNPANEYMTHTQAKDEVGVVKMKKPTPLDLADDFAAASTKQDEKKEDILPTPTTTCTTEQDHHEEEEEEEDLSSLEEIIPTPEKEEEEEVDISMDVEEEEVFEAEEEVEKDVFDEESEEDEEEEDSVFLPNVPGVEPMYTVEADPVLVTEPANESTDRKLVEESLDEDSFLPNRNDKPARMSNVNNESSKDTPNSMSSKTSHSNSMSLRDIRNPGTSSSSSSSNVSAVQLAKERVRRHLRLRHKESSPPLQQQMQSRRSVFRSNHTKVAPLPNPEIMSPPVQEAVEKYKQRIRRALQVHQPTDTSIRRTLSRDRDRDRDSCSIRRTHSRDPSVERQLTVPKGPRLSTSKRLGDKPTPTSSTSQRRGDKSTPPLTKEAPRKLTVPKAPRLSTSQRHGDKSTPRSMATTTTTTQRKSMPMSTKERKMTLTTPQPFSFQKSDPPKKKTLTLMESMEKLWRKGFRESAPPPPPEPPARKRLTVPKTPNFAVAPHRTPPKSTAQLEEEIMQYYEKHPFQARPVGAGVKSVGIRAGSVGDYGVPKIHKKPLTTPAPFQLQTERRATHSLPAQSTEELIALQPPFKARPMPKFKPQPPVESRPIRPKKPEEPPLHIPPFVARPMPNFQQIRKTKMRNTQQLVHQAQQSLKSTKRELTQPKPFRLSVSNTNGNSKSSPSENKSSIFRARKVPPSLFHAPSITPKLTKPKSSPTKQDNSTTSPTKTHTQFKARPVPSFVKKPPTFKKVTPRAVTEPSPFTFHSPTQTKREESSHNNNSNNTNFKARPMPNLKKTNASTKVSSTKALTEPSPFTFHSPTKQRLDKREDSSHLHPTRRTKNTPPSQQREDSSNNAFKARPVPDFTKKPVLPKRVTPKALTEPSPFTFQSGSRTRKNKQRSSSPPTTTSTTRSTTSQTVTTKISTKKTITTPQPFTFRCDERHEVHSKSLQQKVQAEMEQVFRPFQAKPIPKSTFQANFSPTKRMHKTTESKGPQLLTQRKAQARKQFSAKVMEKQSALEALKKKKELLLKQQQEREIKQLRNLPASQGGFIPEAKPILYSSGFSTMQSPRQQRSFSDSSSDNHHMDDGGTYHSEDENTASGLRSLISGFGKVRLRP